MKKLIIALLFITAWSCDFDSASYCGTLTLCDGKTYEVHMAGDLEWYMVGDKKYWTLDEMIGAECF